MLLVCVLDQFGKTYLIVSRVLEKQYRINSTRTE